MFDLNKKVRYDNLAPSLQSMLGGYESIKDITDKIDKIDNNKNALTSETDELNRKLNSLNDDIDKWFNETTNKISKTSETSLSTNFSNEGTSSIINSGTKGQFAKVADDKKSIIASDGFKEISIADNQSDFDSLKNNIVTSSVGINVGTNTLYGTDILDKDGIKHWETIKHFDQNASNILGGYTEGTVTNGQVLVNKPSPDTIALLGNNMGLSFQGYAGYKDGTLAGIISDVSIDGPWYANITINMVNDAQVALIIGYMKDNTGKEHTLSLVRAFGDKYTGKTPVKIAWALIYDMCNPTQHIIMDTANTAAINRNKSSANYGGYRKVSFTMKKTSSMLECTTSNVLPPILYEYNYSDTDELTFRFYMPGSKPPDWDQEMYNNINQMMTSSRIGFAVRINVATLHINNFITLNTGNNASSAIGYIHRFDTNEVYDYKNGSWKKIATLSDTLEENSYYYDKKTNRFIYYKGKNSNGNLDYILL
nr:MAG TPA: hypothetical protein [Caudoviricetes sp.]